MQSQDVSTHDLPTRRFRLGTVALALVFAFLLVGLTLQTAAAGNGGKISDAIFIENIVKTSINDEILSASLIPDASPDAPEATQLQVDTDVSKEKVRPGGYLTYTLRYTNSLATVVSNVVITDRLSSYGSGHIFTGTYQSTPTIDPANFTYSPNAAISGYNLRWNIPSVPANSSGEIIFYTKVYTTPEPSLEEDVMYMGNTVRIYADGQPGITGNYDQDNTAVAGPLFTIAKTVSPDDKEDVYPGHMLTYTLTVLNNNRTDDSWPSSAPLVITDVIPIQTSFAWADNSGVYDAVKKLVQWNIPSALQPGDSYTVRFGVLVTHTIDSGKTIANGKNAFRVISPELQNSVPGTINVNVQTRPVLQKTVVDRYGGSAQNVLPTEYVTYTITVVNPMNAPLSGVVVTDTMPGYPMPFTYIREVGSAPVPEIKNGGRYLRWTVDLPAYGSYSWSFVAQVPQLIDLSNGTVAGRTNTSFTFGNALKASHPSTYFSKAENIAKVKVLSAMLVKKTVEPGQAMNGEEVVYSIELENRSNFLITNIRLTDTLPADFQYVRMENGPQPLTGYTTNPIVWTGLELDPGAKFTMAVRVLVEGGPWNLTVKNNLETASPDAFIPDLVNVAPLKIQPPLAINKTVEPTTAYLGSVVSYDITLTNLDDESWTLMEVDDLLPSGFLQQGGSYAQLVVINVDPDQVIPAGESWSGGFDAKITSVTCSQLPKSYPNAAGAIGVNVLTPEGDDIWAVNAVALAPVLVKPNVEVTLTPYRQYVQVGNLVTYTLTMKNVSDVAVTNGTVTLNLPADFQFVQVISGQAPSSQSGLTFTWNNLSIPINSQVTVQIQVQVPLTAALKAYPSTMSASATGVCFAKLVGGTVTVVDEVVYFKLEAPSPVAPSSLVDYKITIYNRDAYPFVLPSVINLLPQEFTYVSMIQGPVPDQVQDRRVTWNNYTLKSGNTIWYMRTQAAPLYGLYTDRMWAVSPETRIMTETHSLTILPVVDLAKVSLREYGSPGDTIPYTITVVNQSDQPYTNIIITDTLPTGFTFANMHSGFSAPISLGPNMDTPVWIIPSLKSGQTARLAFDALINYGTPNGVYYNHVDGSSATGALPGSIFAAPITVTQSTLSLYKSAGISNALPGDLVPYIITVTNATSVTYSGIRITDTLPSGFTYASVPSGFPSPVSTGPGNTIPVWTIANLNVNQTQVLKFNARIAGGTPAGVYHNWISGASQTGKLPPAFKAAPVTVSRVPVNLSKSTRLTTAMVNSTVPYTITISNSGTVSSGPVVVTDTLPLGFVYKAVHSGTPPPDDLGPGSTQPVWLLSSLAPGETRQFVFDALVQPGTPNGVYYNRISGAGDIAVFPPPLDTAPVEIQNATVSIAKTTSAAYARPGDTIAYTIQVTNESQQVYANVRVTDTLPTGFTYAGVVGSTPAPVSTGSGKNRPAWNIATLSVGQTVTLIFNVLIPSSALNDTYFNTLNALVPPGLSLGPWTGAPVTVTPTIPQRLLYMPIIRRK